MGELLRIALKVDRYAVICLQFCAMTPLLNGLWYTMVVLLAPPVKREPVRIREQDLKSLNHLKPPAT